MASSFGYALDGPKTAWGRLGVVMERGAEGEIDSSVTGDPCVVWDETCGLYRMLYFAQRHVNGHEVNSNAHAVCCSQDKLGPGAWRKLGPVSYANPEALCGDTHKPWVLMDAHRPNVAAQVAGLYWLLTVSYRGRNKVVQAATAPTLAGPWRIQPEPLVDIGAADAFDGYHADTVTAYWFDERQVILVFYKGYPLRPQPDQPLSPYGSSVAAATVRPGETTATRLGKVISPVAKPGHWASGWIGGLQIVPARQGGWYGLMNASPTPPRAVEEAPSMREPAPSQGGWAYTPAEWPVSGWQIADQPIEWIRDLPVAARQLGESENHWRHHLVVVPSGDLYLYYNSGAYGQERLYGRFAGAAS